MLELKVVPEKSLGESVFDAAKLISPEILEHCPELNSVAQRYLFNSTVERKDEGLHFFVPTNFQLKGLEKWRIKMEEVLNERIIEISVRAQERNSCSRGGGQSEKATAEASNQVSLALEPKKQTGGPVQKIFQNRVPPPHFIKSPAFDMPLELMRRWAKDVNSNANSQSFWVYGESGSGKTYLTSQLNEMISRSKNLVKTDVIAFFHEWREALNQKDTFAFMKKYRKDTDVLVLENIEELRGKVGTQTEILFTINALFERGASLVVTSSLNPVELKESLEPQLYSRLLSGMTLEMPRPDRVFKENLWRHLLEQHGIGEEAVDFSVTERLVNLGVSSVRKVYTIFINAIARLSLQKMLSIEDVMQLENLYTKREGLTIGTHQNPRELIDQVAKLCGVGPSAIQGKVRRSDVAVARRFVCLALSKFLGLTNSTISHYLDKDPSTVSYALKMAEKEIRENRHIAKQWNWICSQLGMQDKP